MGVNYIVFIVVTLSVGGAYTLGHYVGRKIGIQEGIRIAWKYQKKKKEERSNT